MLTLTKTSFQGGVWTGVLAGIPSGQTPPTLELHWHGKVMATAEPRNDAADTAQWQVRFELPATLLGEGVHTALIMADGQDAPLATIRILAGESLDQDLTAELDSLRAELDLLKAAFRRHCRETT
ncbi:MAG: hypothetical protein GTO37_14095 [Planctomycetales bacterium]|nr:hypothetical protein [Planctomycetales bacterium]